jgi:hypothetical protein
MELSPPPELSNLGPLLLITLVMRVSHYLSEDEKQIYGEEFQENISDSEFK